MNIINGEKIAESIKIKLKNLIEINKVTPKLAIIYTGYNVSSELYIEKKILWAKELGIETQFIHLPQTNDDEVLKIIHNLNKDKSIDGYILQFPLQKGLNSKKILFEIDPDKDVDGLSPISLGNLYHENPCFVSATALAVIECLKNASIYDDQKYSINELNKDDDELLTRYLLGKKVLIINHSLLVGKPLAAILLKYNTTLTIAHKYTDKSDLSKFVKNCDILITATGRPGIIKAEDIQDGQVLIDVGINKSAQGVHGDIDFSDMKNKNVLVTPVPGGVGPITVAKLLENTYKASIK